jgi:hypothetical protein
MAAGSFKSLEIEMSKKLSPVQVRNAYARASLRAHNVVRASQIDLFAATDEQMADERGAAQCAAGFAAQALAKLENGDYDAFLTNLRLAGDFAEDATTSYHNRTATTK